MTSHEFNDSTTKKVTEQDAPEQTAPEALREDIGFSLFTHQRKLDPRLLTSEGILQLQRTIGNQAVQRLLAKNSAGTSNSNRPEIKLPISPTSVQRFERKDVNNKEKEWETIDIRKITDRRVLAEILANPHNIFGRVMYQFEESEREAIKRHLNFLNHKDQQNRRHTAAKSFSESNLKAENYDIHVRRDNQDVIGGLPEIHETAKKHIGAGVTASYVNSGWLSTFKYDSQKLNDDFLSYEKSKKEGIVTHVNNTAASLQGAGGGKYLHFIFVPNTHPIVDLNDQTAETANAPGIYSTDNIKNKAGTVTESGNFTREKYAIYYAHEYLFAGEYPPGSFAMTVESKDMFKLMWDMDPSNKFIRDQAVSEVTLYESAIKLGEKNYVPSKIKRQEQAYDLHDKYRNFLPDPELDPLYFSFEDEDSLENYESKIHMSILHEQVGLFYRKKNTDASYEHMEVEECNLPAYEEAEAATIKLPDPSLYSNWDDYVKAISRELEKYELTLPQLNQLGLLDEFYWSDI